MFCIICNHFYGGLKRYEHCEFWQCRFSLYCRKSADLSQRYVENVSFVLQWPYYDRKFLFLTKICNIRIVSYCEVLWVIVSILSPARATALPMLDEAEQELKKGQTTQASNDCWHIYCSHFLSVRVEHFSLRWLWPVFCITRKRMLLMDLVVYVKDFKSKGNFIRCNISSKSMEKI